MKRRLQFYLSTDSKSDPYFRLSSIKGNLIQIPPGAPSGVVERVVLGLEKMTTSANARVIPVHEIEADGRYIASFVHPDYEAERAVDMRFPQIGKEDQHCHKIDFKRFIDFAHDHFGNNAFTFYVTPLIGMLAEERKEGSSRGYDVTGSQNNTEREQDMEKKLDALLKDIPDINPYKELEIYEGTYIKLFMTECNCGGTKTFQCVYSSRDAALSIRSIRDNYKLSSTISQAFSNRLKDSGFPTAHSTVRYFKSDWEIWAPIPEDRLVQR